MRIFLAIMMLVFATSGIAQACQRPADSAALQTGMIQWINEQRRAKGLNALKPSAQLRDAAQGHACDMATRNYFAHERAGGPSFGNRIKGEGYRLRRAAENIAKTRQAGVGPAAKIWRNSSGHWANILKPGVSDIGIAIAQGGGSNYWVMNIGQSR